MLKHLTFPLKGATCTSIIVSELQNFYTRLCDSENTLLEMDTFGVGDSRGTGPSQLSSLQEITQCSRERAEMILEAATGNLQRALEIFYAQSEEDREEEESRPAKTTKVDEAVAVKEVKMGNSHNDRNGLAFQLEIKSHASNMNKKLESHHSRSTWRQVPRNNNGPNVSLAAMKNPSVPLFQPGQSLNLNFGLPFPTQNQVFHFGSSSHPQPGPSTATLPLPVGGRPALLPLPVGGGQPSQGSYDPSSSMGLTLPCSTGDTRSSQHEGSRS